MSLSAIAKIHLQRNTSDEGDAKGRAFPRLNHPIKSRIERKQESTPTAVKRLTRREQETPSWKGGLQI
jgi:hypothetical protein